MEKAQKNHGKITEKSWKILGKFLETLAQIAETSWKIHGKIMKKSRKNHENHGKIIEKSLKN